MAGVAGPDPAYSVRKESEHVPALDGIRGLAILMVLAHHFLVVEVGSRLPGFRWMLAARDSMWAGVDVFFALSGFLITGILVKTVQTEGFFRNFYARRALRIFPLYYAVLLLLFACTPLLHIHWGGVPWRLLTYTNRIFIDVHTPWWNFDYGGGVSLIHFWSLHVEEQFYMIWPLLVYTLRSPRRLLPLAVFLAVASALLRFWLAAHGVAHEILYASLLTRADGLFIGGSLALLLQTRYAASIRRFALPLFLGVSVVIVGLFVVRVGLEWWAGGPLLFSTEFTLLAIAVTSLIALCLEQGSVANRVFSTRILGFFGTYSYGLYIFQAVVPIFLREPLLRWLGSSLHHPLLTHAVAELVMLPVILGTAVLSYHFFEKPLLALKRYFAYRVKPAIVRVA